MELGTFPKSLKIGKISPIHKKGEVQLLDNYRPISVLPIFGKIFEKILYNRLYSFFTSKSIIYKKNKLVSVKNTPLVMPSIIQLIKL